PPTSTRATTSTSSDRPRRRLRRRWARRLERGPGNAGSAWLGGAVKRAVTSGSLSFVGGLLGSVVRVVHGPRLDELAGALPLRPLRVECRLQDDNGCGLIDHGPVPLRLPARRAQLLVRRDGGHPLVHEAHLRSIARAPVGGVQGRD